MRARRLPKIVCRELYASDNYRVYELTDIRGKPWGVEIQERTPEGYGRVTYLQNEAFAVMARQTHEWNAVAPLQSECEEFFARAMFFAPNYPLDLH